jgi:ATP-dependent Clp protease ATP-binding subunit ClpB
MQVVLAKFFLWEMTSSSVGVSEEVESALSQAEQLANDSLHTEVAPAHLGKVLFIDNNSLCSKVAKENSDSTLALVRNHVNHLLSTLPKFTITSSTHEIKWSDDLKRIHGVAAKTAATAGKSDSPTLNVEHLLLHLLDRWNLHYFTRKRAEIVLPSVLSSMPKKRPETPTISQYTQDLVSLAEADKLDPVIGREEEISRLIEILCRRTKNNPIMIGPPGTGKSATVEALAIRIAKGEVPPDLNGRILSLSVASLVAGTGVRGEFEKRLTDLMSEIAKLNGSGFPTILFIDEIHTLLGAGATGGSLDAANILKPLLARGELRCIGATTLDEYRKYVEKDAAFSRRFQKVNVKEPSVKDTITMLRGIKDRYEVHHGVQIQDDAVIKAVELSSRYITDRFLPDKAIDLIDEACSSVRVQATCRPQAIMELEREELDLTIELKGRAHPPMPSTPASSDGRGESKSPSTGETESKVSDEVKKLQEKLSLLRAKLNPMREAYEAEKSQQQHIATLREKLQQKRQRLKHLEDFALASGGASGHNSSAISELKYTIIPTLESDLASLTSNSSKQGALEWGAACHQMTPQVTVDHITKVVHRWTGIPVSRMTADERTSILDLGEKLRKRVIGQDKSMTMIADAVIQSRAGLSRPNQPIGSFLFLGSTGVGKTETAKAVAAELFHDESKIVRIDLSEYLDEISINRLIGSPPGYVGHEQGGQLTEAVQRSPYSIVLFDEIEKANPKVLNILLQILDEGKLTDGAGRKVDFCNTLIILTSNMGGGAPPIPPSSSFPSVEAYKKAVAMAGGEGHGVSMPPLMPPELLGRLDEIIRFAPLTKEKLASIAKIQIARLGSRLLEQKIQLDLRPDAVEHLLAGAYDEKNTVENRGARPLRKHLEKEIIRPVAKMLIAGSVKPGSIVTVGVSGASHKIVIPHSEGNASGGDHHHHRSDPVLTFDSRPIA